MIAKMEREIRILDKITEWAASIMVVAACVVILLGLYRVVPILYKAAVSDSVTALYTSLALVGLVSSVYIVHYILFRKEWK